MKKVISWFSIVLFVLMLIVCNINILSITAMAADDENEDILPYEEKQKLMAAAFRKGFRQDSIRTALKNLNVDT